MHFKKYFYISFIGIIISLLTIVGLVVVVDPYQQYRASDKIIVNQRLSNPGIAKLHDYDAVIVGSSMAMNHYANQLDSLFGWNTINLTTMGGTDEDYKLFLPFLVKQGKVKRMVWGIDYFSFFHPTTELLSEPYLYDNRWWNDYSYWINYTSLKDVIRKLRRMGVVNRDELWHFDSPSGREHLLKYYDRDNNEKYFSKDDFSRMEERFDAMERVVMPVLKDVEVYVYSPPYSICEFLMYDQYGHWEQVMAFKEYMIERLLSYPNVKLYDFQIEEFICNMDEYMDLRHHSHAYNKRIIECIHADCFRVTEGNYRQDLLVLDSLVRNFEIPN